MMTVSKKAEILSRNLQKMEGEYRQENKPNTAARVRDVRIELMAQPEVAARLYDALTTGENE